MFMRTVVFLAFASAVDSAGVPAFALVDRVDPCAGLGTPVLHARSRTELVVGCGSGRGLWLSVDAGVSFVRAHPSQELDVFDLKPTRDGALLLCGHDHETSGVLLYRGQPGAGWSPLLSVGDWGANHLSDCGVVAETGDARLVLSDLTVDELTWSDDGGTTWSRARAATRDGVSEDNASAHLFQLVGGAAGVQGAGGRLADPPVFFQGIPSAGGWRLAAVVIDPGATGEVWALATVDGGGTWLAGGRDQSDRGEASGRLYRSTDEGVSWSSVALPEDIGMIRDIAVVGDGRRAVAIGHRSPMTKGGVVLITTDGGASWHTTADEVPLLETVATAGGRYWIAGDAYLAMGVFPVGVSPAGKEAPVRQ